MYFPYLRGRQFELIALRELLESERIGQEIIPIIEPVKPSATLLKTLECFVNHDREIAVPPVSLTTAGRTNSEGIQCLYLASDEETTFHEVRARDNDHVSVGEFYQIKDLKIVDLSLFDKIGPFSIPDFDMTWFAINIDIIRKIGNEVAMPMRRFDRALDYVPTQYICDYVKHLGYDGIRYKSTLVEGGINYAIFDEKKFDCVGVKVVHIGNIHYEWKEL